MLKDWVRSIPRYLEECFRRYPALFFGICLLVGVFLSFSKVEDRFFSLLLCFPLLFSLYARRACLALLLIIAAFISTSLRVSTPVIDQISANVSSPINREAIRENESTGMAAFQGTLLAEVVDRQLVTIHGKTAWKIEFFVKEFRTFDGILLAKGIHALAHSPVPCSVFGGRIYRMQGTFLIDPSMQVRFRPNWSSLSQEERTFSFLELRVLLRKKLEKIFTTLFVNQEERIVAGALTFGLYKEPFLQHLMHRAGVEHVLAISGFHFGIVAALALFFVRGLRPRFRALIAFILLVFYLIAVGPLPSVLRSWWAGTVALLGIFLGKKASGLNCFGVGLIAATLLDPISLTQIGCQLSFLATGAILLYSQYTFELCSLAIRPKRTDEFVSFSFADQVLTTILHRLFPGFSLIIPIWAVIIPYQLAFMPDISFLGVIYNLCIPLLYSLAMPCILLAVLFYPVPFIPHIFSFIGAIPLRCGMFLVQSAPDSSLTSMTLWHMPVPIACFIIIAIFFCGFILEGRSASQRVDTWKACI